MWLVSDWKPFTFTFTRTQECNFSLNDQTHDLDHTDHLPRKPITCYIMLMILDDNCDVVLFQGHVVVGEQWRSSGLTWAEFLDKDQNMEDFIRTNVSIVLCICNKFHFIS